MQFACQFPEITESLQSDEGSRAIMKKTIDFFEHRGRQRLLSDFDKRVWYREFIDFGARLEVFRRGGHLFLIELAPSAAALVGGFLTGSCGPADQMAPMLRRQAG